MKNKISSVEIITPNSKELAEFYGTVFGWDIYPPAGSMEYRVMNPNGDNHVMGMVGDPFINNESWVTFYITVDDIDDMLKKVVACGGKVKVPKFTTDTNITLAYFEDAKGHVVGLTERK